MKTPKVREAIKTIEANGWVYMYSVGSHRHSKHPVKPGKVTIPGRPADDMPPGTLFSVFEAGGFAMNEKFLVIYEHGKRNYGGFVPDVLGCISTGKTLAEMRRMMKEALEAHLDFMATDGDPMPRPLTTSIDFSTFEDPDGEVDHYVVEWLEIEVPTSAKPLEAMTA